MPRRGWEGLSANYRQRLERQGISRDAYESGSSLAKARGHTSAAHERVQSSEYRTVDRWVRHYSETYGRDPDDVREALMEYGRPEALRMIQYQSDMERDYNAGRTDRAATRYQMPRRQPYPDWMFYYHGAFS